MNHCLSQQSYLVDRIAIEVVGKSREFAYTNKEDAFFYSETNSEHRSSWQGFNVFGREFLEDYFFKINDSLLYRNLIEKTIVYPHQLERKYKNGVRETLTLLDSLPVLIIEIEIPNMKSISFIPLVSDFKKKQDFLTHFEQNTLLIIRKNHTERNLKENYPVVLGISSNMNCELDDERNILNYYSPAGIKMSGRKIKIAVGVGDRIDETITMLNYTLNNSEFLIAKRKQRMEILLQESLVETDNEKFNRALMWAKISMDALIMNQITKGIFAGLPWFNNYWGRDSFIALPGATLVVGNYTEARKILTSFAEFQEKDERSINYGRIPNIITTTHKSYNTADGTPRFVIAAYEYYKYSGDRSFVEEIFPVVKKSIDGSLKYRTDNFFSLTHDDADTWMDAVGPDGPWTPRGNRANDIQALWYKQLIYSAEFAKILNKKELANKWLRIADKLKENFNHFFVDTIKGFIFDHINSDGTADKKDRPNQIFCFELLNESARKKVLANIIENLTFEYGVASLSQYDEQFHPYHQNPPYYVKDAAYHQGTVWTWLSGPVISELCKFNCYEKAYTLIQNLVHQLLERGAVGTISELLDAHPRDKNSEPELSGTFSQAWSLSEFIRNFYQDFLNLQFDFSKGRKVYFNPRIPEELGTVKAKIKFGEESFLITYLKNIEPSIEVQGVEIFQPVDFIINLQSDNKIFSFTQIIKNKTSLKATLKNGKKVVVEHNSKFIEQKINITVKDKYTENFICSVPFAVPRIGYNYPVLNPPEYKLYTNSEIKKENRSAFEFIDVTDPAYDDTGFSGYKYPLNPNFVDGILDILKFQVSYDSQYVYFNLKFRQLNNPGWHPEYGFQLTYVAIAIDQDGIVNSGKREIGMNSKYILERDEAFEKIIYVGGGLRADDKNGKIIASYVPLDGNVVNPLGDISNAVISFCLPTEIVGVPADKWRFVVLVGAQDDHGGAGLGDFRNVEQIESEWTGGGKIHPELPNVYDILKSF